ncbi:MAG TPA: hypothetical protein VJJ28_02340 [Candidatus Paceibacterota bacterium]
MTLNRHRTKKILKWILLFCIITLVTGYALFASHDFILGPSLTISEPIDGSTSIEPNLTIRGTAKRIKEIYLNDRMITVDEKGNFSENILLAPGYNIFKLTIRDRFERSKEYRLELIYNVN